jgi:hypothetical protein
MDGVRNIPREVRDGLLFINAEEYKKAIEILLWSLPTILIGLEIGSAIAFLLTITVQYLWESNGGLGWYLLSNQAANNSEGVFAGVLLTCLIGFSLNTGIHKLFDLVSFRESTMTEGIGQRGTRFHKTFRSLDRDLNPSRLPARTDSAPASPRPKTPFFWSGWTLPFMSTRRIPPEHPASPSYEAIRPLLQTDFVTQAIANFSHNVLSLKVVHQGEPYILPQELTSGRFRSHFCLGSTCQRDITISVPTTVTARLDKAPDGLKVLLFARSWIDTSKLSTRSCEELKAGADTIGQIIRRNETEVGYRDIGFRHFISKRLGLAFGASGTVHAVQRVRLITVAGRPAILIHEFYKL